MVPVRDFKIVEESWTDYELADGTFIRMRALLAHLLQHEDKKGFGLQMVPIITSFATRLARPESPGSKLPPAELEKYVEEPNVMFRLLQEGRSVYSTPAGDLEIRLAATGFKRTSKFDEDGQPQYIVANTVEIGTPGKPESFAKAASVDASG